jgi:hypothetical protein
MGKVTGISAGSSDLFTASLVPFYSSPLHSGPVFRVTDPHVKLSKTSDPFRVILTVAENSTAPSFDLTVSGHSADKISNVFAIPILR